MPPLRLRYQTFEFGNTDIHVRTLRNRQEYHDENDVALELGISSANWSLFGVVWASGELLAHLMHEYEVDGLRILEVGCGIALASLLLNQRQANITATDYHPEVGQFLLENTKLNQARPIPFVRANWADEDTGMGRFDLIIGSDLLYERGHADLLAKFIHQHANDKCEVIIIDPGRKHYSRFTARMKSLGYVHRQSVSSHVEKLTQPHRGPCMGHILHYRREQKV